MKAEDNVLNDVDLALKSVSNIGSTALGALKPLKSKQDLVHILLDNERGRLKVWLFPLDHERKSYISGFGGGRSLYEVSPAIKYKLQSANFSPGCITFPSISLG
jgi:phosphatidylinositol 4-kinase